MHHNGGMRTLIAATTAALFALAGAAPAVAQDAEVTVMTRNLYLGADVAVALELIPDMPAAAQFMWEQVAATDFTARAPDLAAEVVAIKPDVIALQEATRWVCRNGLLGETKTVFDFTQQFLDATRDAGTEYVLAAQGGESAVNPGYSIPPIPWLTSVNDPETFQPLFGTSDAACGFEIADALAVRADLADDVLAVGRFDYEHRAEIVPFVFAIDRGYTWADIRINGSIARYAATHLESLWTPGEVPNNAVQARELIADLSSVDLPLVVMGDFNADPRDPRGAGMPNPGGQPEASDVCSAGNPEDSDPQCNAYWAMVDAGFTDAGPDASDPANYTWGFNALLTGPDPARIDAAREMGNADGLTDRLDYIFVRGGVTVTEAELLGQSSSATGLLPTDHAGIVARLQIPATDAADSSGEASAGEQAAEWPAVVFIVAVLVGLGIAVAVFVRRRRAVP